MKIVTMTRDMRPFHRGQDAVLQDDVALRLQEEGAANNLRPFPPQEPGFPSPETVGTAAAKPPPARSYRSKGRRKRRHV